VTWRLVNSKSEGLIFNIQRFAIHDGPGLGTTVFMKGCPLRCRWCSNPESWETYPEIMVHNIKCIAGCRKCLETCPSDAISFTTQGSGIEVDREKCDLCMKCVEVCPSRAIERVGNWMTVEEVLGQVLADKIFYQNSGGGLTISGGEPLLQGEFVTELCKQGKEEGIHITLDTSGYGSWIVMEKVLRYVDLVLFDIKHMDSMKHKEGTEVGNELILSNLKKTASLCRIWIRIPLIPKFNDSDWEIEEVTKFVSELNVEKVSILPYHEWGVSKYAKLGRVYQLAGTSLPIEEHLADIVKRIECSGLKVAVGS